MKNSASLFKTILIFVIATACFIYPFQCFAKDHEAEKDLFLVSQKAFEDGFYDVAIRYIEQLLEQYPQSEKRIQANLLLGQCYFFQKQYLKSYDIFQKLLQYNEFKDATLFWLGETYLKGADYKKAQEQYQQLLDIFSNSSYVPQTLYSLAWCYFEQKDFDNAKDTLYRLLKDYPEHPMSEDANFKIAETEFNLKDYENSIQLFREFINIFPKSTRLPEAHFFIGESYYNLENYLAAVTYYAKTAEISYDSSLVIMARVSMGWSYLKIGKLKLAQKNFDEALDLSQKKGIYSDDVFLGEASLYMEMKDYDQALKAYDLLIEKFPQSQRIIEANLGRANVLYLLKRYNDAVIVYTDLISSMDENNVNEEVVEKAYFGLAWSLLKKGDIDLAIKKFHEIKNRAKNKTVRISALTQIGDAYQDVGELEKAIEVYDELLRDYPDSFYTDYIQYRQGIALLRLKKIEAATLSFQALQMNFPNSKYLVDTEYYLAVANFNSENWAASQEHIQQFIENSVASNPFLEEAFYIQALSYFNLKKYEKAQNIFQEIIERYPQGQDAIIKNSEISIGKCLYKQENYEEAIKQFKSLIFKYPNSKVAEEVIILLGDHYLQLNDFKNAITYYQKFIEEYPGSEKIDMIYYQLAQAYEANEEYDKAINSFKSIKETDRTLFAKAKLAIAEIFTKDLDPKSSIETYENIIRTSPEFKKDAFLKIAKMYIEIRNLPEAIKNLKSAVQADNGLSQLNNADLQFQIADLYEQLNQTKEAVEEYLKVPYLYANETAWIIKAYLRIGRIFEDNEQWEEARITYNKILSFKAEETKFAQERLDWISNNTAQHNK